MKRCLYLFFISIKLFAQEMPVSESNYFVYDKYNFGVDVNNLSIEIHEDATGQIVCSEYSGCIYKLNNTYLEKALPELKDKNPQLIKYFKFSSGKEYYCTNQEIIITKNNKIERRIKLNSQKDGSSSFTKKGNLIYFITCFFDGSTTVSIFDGKKVMPLMKNGMNTSTKYFQLFLRDKLIIIENKEDTITFYALEKNQIKKIKTYRLPDINFGVTQFIDANNFCGVSSSNIIRCKNGILTVQKNNLLSIRTNHYNPIFSVEKGQEKLFYYLNDISLKKLFSTTFSSATFVPKYNKESNSYYSGTTTQFLRFFPYIQKYPRLYNNSNSSATFVLAQDNLNRVWAGSYQGNLTVIDKNKVLQSKHKDIMFMNGSFAYKDKMLLFGEANKGALLFSSANDYRTIAKDNTFFYSYLSKDSTLYLGSSGKGLWHTAVKNLDKKEPISWNIVSEKQGQRLFNIITICEDKFGNIWTGRSSQGISVYNPDTKKAKTWLLDEKQIDFGSMASCLDKKKNTLWFGTDKGGLVYYDGKSKTDYAVRNFKSIQHPLLENGKGITFIHQWNDYLILGAKEKVLLFDLKKWYTHKTVAIRYLNSMEINLTNSTEQNTIFTDKRDESVWFASSDMVYQWDIKKWLTLPTFTVQPNIIVKKEHSSIEYSNHQLISFEPTENSFDIQIHYQTEDNMPRFINATLIKKGEKLVFEHPNLETNFLFKNLSAGNYVFYIRVCQQDGSFDVLEYPICIDSFLWQKWWFWLLFSLPVFGIVFYIFKKKNQIEKQKKKLSELNLSSLSNQFRPHLMLNALNSIGSQMQGKPHAEKVISRLGESINILYGFTQKNEFTLGFENEMKLVKNSIEIQKLLFIPKLIVKIRNLEVIPIDYKIPVGIIQIPVENALLHGLRHKINGDYQLEIAFEVCKNNYHISITDNGVGREKAAKINNFKTNGNGLKTVFEMITIINQHQKNAIVIEIIDQIEPSGTLVKITLNKNIDYEKIKI